jgi:hypothetical protein
MGNWQQIGGDMTWEKHGLVLAKDDPRVEQVYLVRVTPWLEHDREAAVTHGLYLVDEKTVDYDDLEPSRPEVQQALRSTGVRPSEYDELGRVYKADLLASVSGYEDSRSVNKLAAALPDAPEKIDFWGQRETGANLEEYDRQARREALEANFRTTLTYGTVPPIEALEFALGDEEFNMDLEGQPGLAFEYARLVAGISGDTSSAETLAETLNALASAPPPAELDPDSVDSGVASVLDEWERRYGDPDDESDGIAEAARSIASDIMSAIGFEWI